LTLYSRCRVGVLAKVPAVWTLVVRYWALKRVENE
jgi:hypothetical protein